MPRLQHSTLLIFVVLLAFVPAARANEDAKERAALKACLSGNYKKGVEILSDLFVTTQDPVFIFNQGRCFEQNGRCEEAITRFREYLRKAKKASAEGRAEAEKHIADCKALMKETTSGEPAPVPKVETPTAPRPTPEPVATVTVAPKAEPGPVVAPKTEPTAAVTKAEPAAVAPKSEPADGTGIGTTQIVTGPVQEPAPASGRGLRIAGIALGAVGVASVATAVYFYTRARSYSDKVSNQITPDPSDESAGKNAQTMQWVFYGIGGAAIATGTVLYVLGWQKSDNSRTSTAIAPLFGPGVAGLSAQGAF